MKKKKYIIVCAGLILIVTAGIALKLASVGGEDDQIKLTSLSREAVNTIKPVDEKDGNRIDKDKTGRTDYEPDEEEGKGTIDTEGMVNEDGTIDVYIDGVMSVKKLPDSTIQNNADKPDVDPKSRTVLVNKMYPLEDDYKPDDLVDVDVKFSINYADEKRKLRQEAAEALEAMFECAGKSGVELIGVSGFRSFERQKTIYNNNLIYQGYDHTNKYSARPGRSEHQTGWAIDISCESMDGNLTDEFIGTPEGQWVKKNCFRFGFVVRYPKSKEDITGYSYEPWHIRYVGYDLARYLYEQGITLDEYYGYEADLEAIEKEEKEYYDEFMGIGYEPTYVPMDEPTLLHTDEPQATDEPTEEPTDTPKPTETPTPQPTDTPTQEPTDPPTEKPTEQPTETPTKKPTEQPTKKPTKTPEPTQEATATQTEEPTKEATRTPRTTRTPRSTRSAAPTQNADGESTNG